MIRRCSVSILLLGLILFATAASAAQPFAPKQGLYYAVVTSVTSPSRHGLADQMMAHVAARAQRTLVVQYRQGPEAEPT